MSIVFGPIPSRRLGRSLGVNNIPPKVCSYSCVYCQIGNTNSMSIRREEFYSPDEIVKEVSEKVIQLQSVNEKIDYLTFVPDGEPTLDINLGKEIDLLKSMGIKIAVITNSSLLWDKNVRNDLIGADWVSVKVDTVDEKIWHQIDRPNGRLQLSKIIDGIRKFALTYKGKFVTETMLVKGLNDDINSLQNTAELLKEIDPDVAYILVPTRPPTEKFVELPAVENLNIAYQVFSGSLKNVELLISNEGTDFSFYSDAEKELVSILSVHPMRKDAIETYLNKANSNWNLINDLIRRNVLKEIQYSSEKFFVRNINGKI
jgi:wyosine [tRNA(Phe)-imidazoG37] synthetase (radical SAM superfamily)